MTDSSIPLDLKNLEKLVTMVASDLLEQWAITDRFAPEEQDKYSQLAVEDTIFVINNYMGKFNEIVKVAQAKIETN